MPKPRLSSAQAKARGADQVNAGRFADRADAPPTTGEVGEAPKRLSAPEKLIWKELVSAIPAGVAGEADRFAVELAVRLLGQFHKDPAGMPSSRVALLMNALSRLGLDPQARTRLHVAPPAPEAKSADPLNRFLNAISHAPKQQRVQ